MSLRPRWARECGGVAWRTEDHAETLLGAVKEAVRSRGNEQGRDQAVLHVLEIALAQAFAAGEREGRTAYQAQVQSMIQAQIDKAVRSVQLDPAPCPHCLGRGCGECRSTGKRAKLPTP